VARPPPISRPLFGAKKPRKQAGVPPVCKTCAGTWKSFIAVMLGLVPGIHVFLNVAAD
jgi:hypothetical protein